MLLLRKSKDTDTHLKVYTLRNDPLVKHSAPSLWLEVAGLVSPPACLPLTSSLPGLPVCRWGAKPQSLRGQENNKSLRPFTPTRIWGLSPSSTSVSSPGSACALKSSQEDPLVFRSLPPHNSTTHALCLSKPCPSSRSTSHMTSCDPSYLPAGSDFSLLYDPSFFVSFPAHMALKHSSLWIYHSH